MANHGAVKTRKHMSSDAISQMLNELNESYFKNHLKFEYNEYDADSGAYGQHVWQITYDGPDFEYLHKGDYIRICWLNTKQSLEMRHGGGGVWSWWVASVILNEVAVRFNGKIEDDGVEEKWEGVPDKFKTFAEYHKAMHSHIKGKLAKIAVMKLELRLVPPAFRRA